jgi:integration host factor subunit beta
MVTKAMLAKELKKEGLPYNAAVSCINALFESMAEHLSQNKTIELRGFGTFYIGKRAACRPGINGSMAVPKHGRVLFRPGEKLRRAAWKLN